MDTFSLFEAVLQSCADLPRLRFF